MTPAIQPRALPPGVYPSFDGAPPIFVWQYTRAGVVIGYVVRYQVEGKEKSVIPFFNGDDKKWTKGYAEGLRPLYGLESIPIETDVLYIVEGERCARALHNLGLPCVTSPGGSNAVHRACWTALEGVARVRILPDEDEPGYKYAQKVKEILGGLQVPPGVEFVRLPELGQGEDVVDFLMRIVPGWDGFGPIPIEPGADLLAQFMDVVENSVTDSLPTPELADAFVLSQGPLARLIRAQPTISVAELNGTILTEHATAKRLKEIHGGGLRHARGMGWMVWNGKHWGMSEKAARRFAHDLGDHYRQDVIRLELLDADIVKQYFKHARLVESARGVRDILDLSSSLDGIDADNVEWDASPWLLNCPNGVVDLRTGEVTPHRPELYITAFCPTPYNPNATCPRFEQFLNEVFEGDSSLVDYLQWVSGYALTGITDYHIFFILHGGGRNGKGVFLDTLSDIMGDNYATALNSEALLVQAMSRHSTELAKCRGARLVVASETSDGQRINDSLIKRLTGGDLIAARFMRQDEFEFRPQFKLFMPTNHRPVVRDSSVGMWSRIRLLPFEAEFTAENGRQDPHLRAKLMAEHEGILNWMVEGAKRVQYCEPYLPKRVREAVDDYQAEQDTLGIFLEEQCDFWEYTQVEKGELYRAYSRYTNGRCESRPKFSERMKKKGFGDKKGSKGVHVWLGLRLKLAAELSSDDNERGWNPRD